MKLKDFYSAVIEAGIENDLRGREEIGKLLAEERVKFEKLDEKEKEYFDRDRLFNPFSDTRILHGHGEIEFKKAIVGIDMEVGEVLLTYLLNRDLDRKIDLIIAHHPEGYALARLFDVMKLQSDLMALSGINLSVAEKLMEKRIGEVERRLMPVNHNRTVDVAKLLDLPMICIHTAADNCVTRFLNQLFEKEKPGRLKDILQLLQGIAEYQGQTDVALHT